MNGLGAPRPTIVETSYPLHVTGGLLQRNHTTAQGCHVGSSSRAGQLRHESATRRPSLPRRLSFRRQSVREGNDIHSASTVICPVALLVQAVVGGFSSLSYSRQAPKPPFKPSISPHVGSFPLRTGLRHGKAQGVRGLMDRDFPSTPLHRHTTYSQNLGSLLGILPRLVPYTWYMHGTLTFFKPKTST